MRLPKSKFTGTAGEVRTRAKERALVMAGRHPGTKFSVFVGNRLGVEAGRKAGVPGAGLPQAIFKSGAEPVSDAALVEQVVVAANRWAHPATGYVTYTTIQEATGLSYATIFGAVNYMRGEYPGRVSFSVNGRGDNVVVKFKEGCRYHNGVL